LSVSSISYEGKIARQGIVRDITQQKLFEKALIKSEKKYRRIFENMKEGMIVTDHEGRIDTVNPAALEIFGYNSPEDMIGKYAADGYADPGQRKVVFRNLFERGYVKDVEMSFKKSDGTLADIIGSATLHRDKAGNILRTEVIFSDITERKKIEDKLKRSEYKYRTLVESINDLIFSVDLEGRFMFINNAFEKIFDYPLDVMKKAYGFAYVHPDDLELVKEKYRTVLEGGSVENVEFRQKREPTRESYIHLSVNATPLYDEQNNIIGVTGIGRDITELQRVKQDLKEIKSISGAYLEATTDLAVLIDTNGTILDANQEFGKRFSQGIKNLKGKNVYTLFPEEIAGKRKKMGKKVIESRKPLRIQDQRDGKWNDATIYPLLDETGNVSHMAIFTHDITELKENEKKLRDSEKELERKILKRTAELEEVNTALRVLIKNRDADVKEMEGRIIFNINELIMPSLERLKNDNLNERQKTLIGIMEDNLVNITSQFAQGKEAAYLKFTPAEMMVANLVKQGKTNKEIAELYHLSTRTIESHRDSIRKKIGLKNRKVNLRSYLMTGN